jgi:hypothetical protein
MAVASFEPWRRVGVAVMVLLALGGLAFIAFREGGYGAALAALETFFQQQGIAEAEAGNAAAGALQSTFDLVFLTGVLGMFGYVQQGFRRRAETRLAARTIFSAYRSFVRMLDALRGMQEKHGQPISVEQIRPRLARLEQAMDELGAVPLHFFSVMPEAANEAIADVRFRLSPFRAFAYAVQSPGSAAAARPRTLYIGSASVGRSGDTVRDLHEAMTKFFVALGAGAAIRRDMQGALQEIMQRCAASANNFITIAPAETVAAPAHAV